MYLGKPGFTFIADCKKGSFDSIPNMISSIVLNIISDSSPIVWHKSVINSLNFWSSSRINYPVRNDRVTEIYPFTGFVLMKILRSALSLYLKANLVSSTF